ncbi:TrmB family transcriptional regulator [Halorubrum sp. SP3]|uniref:TrmB family transcriptional regulator n=3 Tax=unclassified Halorubrum TaxID=2642239 RepID=UPI0010F60688|nr:TrmB family transcriptional regulator [Halorubrum sp. SP3]TKX55832.1 TrmB family transcriptional regulator [Halorubrum sp. SP3]
METDALISTLEDAGLSPYQAAVYVALLDLGTASATSVADASDIPNARVYDVIDALAEREYIEKYEQGTLKARAHSPAVVLDDLRDRADRLESAADEIEDRWEQPPLEKSTASIVKQFQTVIDRARLFIEQAETRVYVSVTPEQLEQLREPLKRAHERGVAVHVLVYTESAGDPPTAESVSGICHEARYRGLPAPFVASVDRQSACFSHHPDAVNQYGVLVNDEEYTFVFHWFFMTCLWAHGTPIYSERQETLPIEYVDIRQFIREARPLFESEATVTVRVEGTNLATGEPRTVTGTVEGVQSVVGGEESDPQIAGQVTLIVDTGHERVRIGGWNAVVEDVEATRIVVTDVADVDSYPSLRAGTEPAE